MLLVNGSVDATRSYYSTGLLDITSQFGAPHFSETPYVLSRAMAEPWMPWVTLGLRWFLQGAKPLIAPAKAGSKMQIRR